MDRVTSNILGRPLAIRDEDIDTAMAEETSEAILTQHPQVTPTRVSRTAVFNSIIRYRLLCGRILTTLHRHRDEQTTLNEAIQSRDHLAEKLETWLLEIRGLGLAGSPTSSVDGQSCFLSEVWFCVLYANAKLMIWRPCPLLSDLSNDRISLQKIYESSVQAINVYAQLHKSRKINYSWITLQSCFLAGLSFMYVWWYNTIATIVADLCVDTQSAVTYVVDVYRTAAKLASWNTSRQRLKSSTLVALARTYWSRWLNDGMPFVIAMKSSID